MRETGIYQILGNVRFFIPHVLPPRNPPFELTVEMMDLYGQANFALGKLNEITLKMPDQERFIKGYVIKEALLSSAIEGIHTTLIDVFTHPLGDGAKISKETQLVLNYTKALDAALKMIEQDNLPLIIRVILKAHEELMSAGAGESADPGQFRKQSVRVGSLVPPPAPEIPRLMGELERYINEPSELPPLIQAGLAHVQFETIHPFLDGNGRIGRLLIVLMLIDSNLLHSPILYPSYYFKKHHAEYYQKLDAVRTNGDYEGWIVYYLTAVRDSALDAYTRAQEIETLENKLKNIIQCHDDFSKIQDTATLALNILFRQPIMSVAQMAQQVGKAYNTAQTILSVFVLHGVVSENIVNKRNKVYRFDQYLALLEKEYE